MSFIMKCKKLLFKFHTIHEDSSFPLSFEEIPLKYFLILFFLYNFERVKEHAWMEDLRGKWSSVMIEQP